jgi:hypothetical protein
MGLTKDFFIKPVIVLATYRAHIETDGVIETAEYVAVFRMNRETVGQRNGLDAPSFFSNADNLERFCKQLAIEPEGIDDFPADDRPLEIRAREYFSPDAYVDLIRHVVMEVEKAQKPIEFFRRF